MSSSPSPSRPSFRARMGTIMRKSSSALTTPTLRRSESKSSLSDSGKESRSSSLKIGTTLAPPTNSSQHVVSPVAESPAREAVASNPSPAGPPLTGDSAPQPENPPVPESVPSEPPARSAFATEELTTEPDQISSGLPAANAIISDLGASEPPMTSAFVPPTEAGPESSDKAYGLHHLQPAVEPEHDPVIYEEPVSQVVVVPPAAQDLESSNNVNQEASSLPHTPPPMRQAPSLASKRSNASFGRKSVAESVAEPEEIRHGQVSAKPSKSSLTSSYTWSARADPNQSRYLYMSKKTGADSSVHDSIDDPFVDPPSRNAASSSEERAKIAEPEPQPYQLDEPAHYEYMPPQVYMSPLAIHDAIPSKSDHTVPSTRTVASRRVDTAVEHDESLPLLSRMPLPQASGNPKAAEHALQTYHADNPWASSGSSLQTLGWRHITLPDNTVYFVHSSMRLTTDIDLRIAKNLEAMTTYLQHSQPAEDVLPPEGWELWLGDASKTKNDFTPVRSWVNHAEKTLSFDFPPRDDVLDGFTHHISANDDDRLDVEYRYWAFMESHPAHVPLPHNARAEALDALTWSYTDCLLPSTRPIPPPFAQEECQELMTLLRSLGSPQDSDSQKVVHTRIVSRILMRLAQWRQHYFRPDKPLPRDAGNSGPRRRDRRVHLRKTARDFLISVLCLGLPYLFLNRAHPFRIVDEESGMRSPGPMLAIGACSSLVAAIILSASVTLITLPGLDNLGRIAGFVAILCSTASMISAVMALFRYKADIERTVVYIGGEGLVILSRRSIIMSLPLVFLAWGIAAFIAGITLYSFKGFTVTSPGLVKQHFEDFTHWVVVGVMGVLAGMLITSALLLRR